VPPGAAAGHDHPVIRWLMSEARGRSDPNDFLEAFAQKLREGGVDVARITTGVPILHPQIFSFSGLWELGKGTTERLFRSGPDIATTMLNSPIRIAYEGGGPVRCDLTTPPREGEFTILADLRRDGFADYIVHAVPFADGSHKALSFATRRPGGFNDDELALFAAMIPAVAFNLEVQALRRTARTLLDTYVGTQSGGRVLDGQIQRGSGETIRAVIWLCDLRGFTSLSEKLSRDDLIGLLNSYFGPMCDAVAGEGGEVLKFIGDAMLAIFPIHTEATQTCAAALSAARHAQAALAEENARRARESQPRIDYGWRCMSATSCMAISAATPGSTSR
jgi:adenylate cyclase